jgi:hypothetical protein
LVAAAKSGFGGEIEVIDKIARRVDPLPGASATRGSRFPGPREIKKWKSFAPLSQINERGRFSLKLMRPICFDISSG